jgi:hypothetical protein
MNVRIGSRQALWKNLSEDKQLELAKQQLANDLAKINKNTSDNDHSIALVKILGICTTIITVSLMTSISTYYLVKQHNYTSKNYINVGDSWIKNDTITINKILAFEKLKRAIANRDLMLPNGMLIDHKYMSPAVLDSIVRIK